MEAESKIVLNIHNRHTYKSGLAHCLILRNWNRIFREFPILKLEL
jgi:hypothetical protein